MIKEHSEVLIKLMIMKWIFLIVPLFMVFEACHMLTRDRAIVCFEAKDLERGLYVKSLVV